MRFIRILLGTFFALAVSAGCGYLIYVQLQITYLPQWLRAFVIVICGIAVIATLFIWIAYIVSTLSSNEKDS